MRCLGLTENRLRCPAQAVTDSGYCTAHVGQFAIQVGPPTPGDHPRTAAGLLARLNRANGNGLPPDPAKYDLPTYYRRRTTGDLVEEILHHADNYARWRAAFALRKRRDPSAIEALWRVLEKDGSRLVRQQTAVALGKIGTAAVLGPLIMALAHDRDAGVRQAAAVALGNLGLRAAAGHIADLVSRERDPFVRWDCVLALGQLGDASHAPLIARLAADEPVSYVRKASRDVLPLLKLRPPDLPTS